MKPTTVLSVLFAGLILSPGLLADHVVMTNGDRLSGTIVKSDDKGLTMTSEFAGTVTIQWDGVAELSSEEPLNLVLEDERKLVGRVKTKEGRIAVATEEAGQVMVATASIRTIRSQQEEEAYQAEVERLRNPGLLDLLSGHVDLGYAAARGNADTTTFNLGLNAARTGKRDKLAVALTSIRAMNTTAGVSQTTANATRGGLKYDRRASERVSVFGFTDLEFDEFQNLDLRFVTGGGLDFHVLKRENTTIDVSGGGAFNKENFSTGFARSSGEVLVGQQLRHRLIGKTVLEEKLTVYPNVTDVGAFRINFDISAVAKLNTWLSWQLTFSDRFLSNPIPGNKKNDYLFTTGLRITFEKE